jgi:NAD-dependent SIR2 family protein deacetylase
MSKIKEFYHEEINAAYREVPEPYIFKFIAHFNYMGKSVTLMADSLDKLEELACTVTKQSVLINHGTMNGEYVLMFENWDLPIILFSVENAYY